MNILPTGALGHKGKLQAGDELLVVHRLCLSGLFPMAAADLTSLLIEGEAFWGQKRTNYVFADPLGFFLGFGPGPAVELV